MSLPMNANDIKIVRADFVSRRNMAARARSEAAYGLITGLFRIAGKGLTTAFTAPLSLLRALHRRPALQIQPSGCAA